MNKDKELHKLDVLNEKQRKHINLLEMQKERLSRRYEALKQQFSVLYDNYMCAIKKLSDERLADECENYEESVGIDRILTDVNECQIINIFEGDLVEMNFKEIGIKW